jgi:hypothetical protein
MFVLLWVLSAFFCFLELLLSFYFGVCLGVSLCLGVCLFSLCVSVILSVCVFVSATGKRGWVHVCSLSVCECEPGGNREEVAASRGERRRR